MPDCVCATTAAAQSASSKFKTIRLALSSTIASAVCYGPLKQHL